MAENVPNLRKETDILEAQRIQNKMKPKRPTTRYIVIKIKIKEAILKESRGKQ